MWGSESPNTQVENVEDFGRFFSTFFCKRRAQLVEVWLMTRTRQAGPWVNVRIYTAKSLLHWDNRARTNQERGTQENLEVDRLVPEPMEGDPTQRLGDNAFRLPVFLAS